VQNFDTYRHSTCFCSTIHMNDGSVAVAGKAVSPQMLTLAGLPALPVLTLRLLPDLVSPMISPKLRSAQHGDREQIPPFDQLAHRIKAKLLTRFLVAFVAPQSVHGGTRYGIPAGIVSDVIFSFDFRRAFSCPFQPGHGNSSGEGAAAVRLDQTAVVSCTCYSVSFVSNSLLALGRRSLPWPFLIHFLLPLL